LQSRDPSKWRTNVHAYRPGFPATAGAFQPSHAACPGYGTPDSSANCFDAFGIAVDSFGKFYLTGRVEDEIGTAGDRDTLGGTEVHLRFN